MMGNFCSFLCYLLVPSFLWSTYIPFGKKNIHICKEKYVYFSNRHTQTHIDTHKHT